VWAKPAAAATVDTRVAAAEIAPLADSEFAAPANLQPAARPLTVFDGVADDVLLEPLRTGKIVKVKVNKGGSSISLRLDFDNGSRAAFKPNQTNMQTIPRKEVAAFRINRLLGLNSVAPAVGREFHWDDIVAALAPDHRFHLPRLQAEMVRDDGFVAGELSWWIPVITHAEITRFRIDSVEGIVTWKRYLAAGGKIPPRARPMAAQISDMLLFDFVINNMDRWSGGNTRASADGSTLYFMDNTLSFGVDPDGHPKSLVYLQRAQRFSRSLVTALRNLDRRQLRAALDHDVEPFDELLTDGEVDSVLSRRDVALDYIGQLIELHGEAEVLVFP